MSQRQIRKFVETATIIAALSLTLTSYSLAASDIFLKIDGVQGESADDKHRGEIDVLSWSWGAHNPATTHIATGAGAGRPDFQDVSITKYLDKSSPVLVGKISQGTIIPEVHLTMRKAGTKQLEYYKLHMYDCLISSITTGGAGTDTRTTENISINFAKFKVEYVPQKADGSADVTVPYSYNIQAAKPM